MLSIVVLISGTGSNLKAIQAAIDAGRCRARIAAVVSDRSKAKGLDLARERGIPTEVVRLKDHPDRDAWNRGLAEAVARHEPGLVVLAGFMRIVNRDFVERFPNRIINVHPSLLPAFPGADGPAQAVAARVQLSGCTVHLVDAGVDTGPILAQAAVRVHASDSAESLHARIQRIEHHLLFQVIDKVSRGALVLASEPTWQIGSQADEDVFIAPGWLT